MSDLLVPGLEIVPKRLPQPETVELFEMVEVLFTDNNGLMIPVDAQQGSFKKEVPHTQERDNTISIVGRLGARRMLGTRMLSAIIGLNSPDTEARMVIQRRNMRAYNFADDPYVEMFTSSIRAHLEAS
jgi:hypothetical protein